MALEEIRVQIAQFLGKVIFENQFIFFDFWSIVHFFAGFLLFGLIFSYKPFRKYRKKPFQFVLTLLILFEIGEFVIYSNPEFFNSFILVEKRIDLIWDLIIGMLGALVRKNRS